MMLNIVEPLQKQDRPIVVSDLSTILPLDAPQTTLQGILGALIGAHDQPVGVILFGHHQPRDWQDREISLVSILANQVTQALESARLFDEVRRSAVELEQRVKERITALAEANQQILEEKDRLETVHA